MSQKIYNRERYKRLKAKRQFQNPPGFWLSCHFFHSQQKLEQARAWHFQDRNRAERLLYLKRKVAKSVHGGICFLKRPLPSPLANGCQENLPFT
jgi:hypothetical protein